MDDKVKASIEVIAGLRKNVILAELDMKLLFMKSGDPTQIRSSYIALIDYYIDLCRNEYIETKDPETIRSYRKKLKAEIIKLDRRYLVEKSKQIKLEDPVIFDNINTYIFRRLEDRIGITAHRKTIEVQDKYSERFETMVRILMKILSKDYIELLRTETIEDLEETLVARYTPEFKSGLTRISSYR